MLFLNGSMTNEELLACKKMFNFHCPQCQGKVYLKIGTIKIAHFAHAAKKTCNSFSEPESLVHIQGKLQLYHWLSEKHTDVEVEKTYRHFNQRADIGLNVNGVEYALEFQRSALTYPQFLTRTQGYYNHGITPLWLLSHDTLSAQAPHKLFLRSFHQQFIRYSKTLRQFFLLTYDVHSMTFIIYQLYFPLTKTTFTYLKSTVRLDNIHFPQFPLLNRHLIQQQLVPYLKSRIRWGDQRLIYGKGHGDLLLQKMYTSRLSVQLLPPWVGLPVRAAMGINEPIMEWQSYLFLFIYKRSEINRPFDSAEAASYTQQYITSRKVACDTLELRDNNRSAIIQYLDLLVKIKILIRVESFFHLNKNNPFTKIEHIHQKERIYDLFHQEVTQDIIDHFNCTEMK